MARPNPVREYWSTKGWRTSTPEEQGIDSQGLVRALDFITKEDHGPAPTPRRVSKLDAPEINCHNITVIRHGYLVADVYFYPYAPGFKHNLASCSKSITATVVGTALDKGYIKSVKQPALELFPNRTVANIDANKKAMTLEDLLTMRTGLDFTFEQGELTLRLMMQSPDWVQFTLDLPMKERPGTRFEYCSPGSHLLSAIVKENTGISTEAFAQKYLFEPLGIADFAWPADHQGVNYGFGEQCYRPHDMAKIGYLYLNNGFWDGEQILSPEWVAAATTKHTKTTLDRGPFDGYGYQWWVSSLGFYAARGAGGQNIIVIPEKDMVVVITAGHDRRDVTDKALTSFIIPAAKSITPLPPNPEGVATLKSRIDEIARGRDQKLTPAPLPEIAKKISGKTFKLNNKPREGTPYLDNWESFSISFDKPDEAMLGFSRNRFYRKLPVRLDNTFSLAQQGKYHMPVALRGSWEKDNVFVVQFNEVGDFNTWRITMTFEGDRVVLLMQDPTWHGDATFDGRLSQN
ncbi:MAG: serine hydrolase [Chloroflexota bacterium]